MKNQIALVNDPNEFIAIMPYVSKHPSDYWYAMAPELKRRGELKMLVIDGKNEPCMSRPNLTAALVTIFLVERKRESGVSPGRNYKTYLMRDERNGMIKIGKSINPCCREKTLQSQEPSIKLFAVCAQNIESALHKEFADHRKRGEWFQLDQTQVDCIIKQHGFKRKNH